MTTLLAIFTVPFSFTACFYFGCRTWLRYESDGHERPFRARLVSAALAFISIGPLVVAGMACGWIGRGLYIWCAALACSVAVALVAAILGVEEMEEQARSIRDNKRAAKELLDQVKATGQFVGPPARKRR